MNFYDHYKFKHSVNSSSDFPKEEHLALIEFRTIHIPGDERSRQCPGHGYPESSEKVLSYSWFKLEDREHWLYFIKDLMGNGQYSKKDFIAIERGKMVQPKLTVEVEI